MQADRRGAAPDAARATNSATGALLLVAASVDASPLREVVEWARATAVELEVSDLDAAPERLATGRFAVVFLDLAEGDGRVEERVRELAGSATVMVRGGAARAAEADRGAGACLEPGDSPSAIIECIRGALDRVRAEQDLQRRWEELAESEARFRNIIGRTADGIVIVGLDGIVLFVNHAAERMFARAGAELLGQQFGVALVSGETTEMDIVGTAETEPVVAELSVSATSWDGAPAQIISLRDITDRKQGEERAHRLLLENAALGQAEKEVARALLLADASAALDASLNLETTLLSLANLVVPRIADWCVIDLLEGACIRRAAGVHADPARQELLDELKEKYLPSVDSPQPSARVLASGVTELHQGLEPASLRELAVDDAHADLLAQLGTHSTMTVALESREHDRLGAITFVCDDGDFDESDVALATEIARRAARALDNARLFESALVANRVKSDFLAVMSHELRTPLTAIIGYTDLLLEGLAGEVNAGQEKYIRRVRAGGTQLLQIVQEILSYAEMEAGRAQARPRAITVGELIDEVIVIAEPLAVEKGLELRLHVEQRDETIYTDVGKLRQIVLNLLTNAVKFTDAGRIEVNVGLVDDELRIVICDTGIGIQAAELEEIFEPFRQVEQGRTRRAGGTGLGLSVSRQLAELVGGHLSVESTAGQGSTFTLRIPVGDPEANTYYD